MQPYFGDVGPDYNGPGYANERQYLGRIPFNPTRQSEPLPDYLRDREFRPMRDRRRPGLTPRGLRGTLADMQRLKAAGRIGQLVNKYGYGWPDIFKWLLLNTGLIPDPFEPWAGGPFTYDLLGNGFELCCKTSDLGGKFSISDPFAGPSPGPACSIEPGLTCGLTGQVPVGSYGDSIVFTGAGGSGYYLESVFLGPPTNIPGTRMRYDQRWSRLRPAPFGPAVIPAYRPQFRVPNDGPMPSRSPLEIPPKEDTRAYRPPRHLRPYEVPSRDVLIPPDGRGPPIIRDGRHVLAPNKGEKKLKLDGGKLGDFYGLITEYKDFLECAEKALPKNIPRVGPGLYERTVRVWNNLDKVDAPAMTDCLMANKANDAVIGKYNALANRGLAMARRRGYYQSPRGIGFGSFATRMR